MASVSIDGRRPVLDARLVGDVNGAGIRRIIDALIIGATSAHGDRRVLDLALLGVLGDPILLGALKGFAQGMSAADGTLSITPMDEILLGGLGASNSSAIAAILAQASIYGAVDSGVLSEATLSRILSASGSSAGMSSASGVLSSGFTLFGSASSETDATAIILAMLALSATNTTYNSVSGYLSRVAGLIGAVSSLTSATATVTLTPGSSFDTDAQAYLDGYAPSSSADFKQALNGFVSGLKTDGIWSKLDWLIVPADTSAGFARNVRNLAKALSLANSPAYTAYRGMKGDGVSSHASLQEAFNASGNLFALNSATIGIYVNQEASTASAPLFGSSQSTRTFLTPNPAGAGSFRMNDSSSYNLGAAETLVGHRTVTRTGAAARAYYRNGVLSVSDTAAASAVATGPAYILRNATQYAADRAALFYSGSSFTDSDATKMHSRVTTFLSAIGAT